MKKKEFVEAVRQKLEQTVPLRFSRISVEETEDIVNAVFGLLKLFAAEGDIIPTPVGKVYAKTIARGGKIGHVKLGLSSYKKVDEWMRDRYVSLFGDSV